tara:strand:+ start:246 stop:452 length:207 start_codon:yes stop_codon:yes gene_type:complete
MEIKSILLEVPPKRSDNSCMMNENELRVLKVYIEECEIHGKLLTIKEFSEDIENSIGWDEVRNPDYDA